MTLEDGNERTTLDAIPYILLPNDTRAVSADFWQGIPRLEMVTFTFSDNDERYAFEMIDQTKLF
jgi:hypothetical protein